jgi:hypothetical protein
MRSRRRREISRRPPARRGQRRLISWSTHQVPQCVPGGTRLAQLGAQLENAIANGASSSLIVN